MRRLVPFLAALATAALLVSCGGGSSSGDASTLDAARDANEVRIGVRNDNPPMSFIDSNGAWIGFDIDLAEAMAKQIGLPLVLVPVNGTTRISFLQEGRVDMSIASMNYTRARDESIGISASRTSGTTSRFSFGRARTCRSMN